MSQTAAAAKTPAAPVLLRKAVALERKSSAQSLAAEPADAAAAPASVTASAATAAPALQASTPAEAGSASTAAGQTASTARPASPPKTAPLDKTVSPRASIVESLGAGGEPEALAPTLERLRKLFPAPRPQLPAPIKVMDDQMRFQPEQIQRLLSDFPGCFIVGVLGRPGVGKSTVLSTLTSAAPFPVSGKGKGAGQQHTRGIDMYVTPDHVVLLDTQPVLCRSVAERLRGSDFFGDVLVRPGPPSQLHSLVEIESIKMTMFLLSVCHVVIVVSDSPRDVELFQLIRKGEAIRKKQFQSRAQPGPPSASGASGVISSPSPTGLSTTSPAPQQVAPSESYEPRIVFVANKASQVSFTPQRRMSILDSFWKSFLDSELQVAGLFADTLHAKQMREFASSFKNQPQPPPGDQPPPKSQANVTDAELRGCGCKSDPDSTGPAEGVESSRPDTPDGDPTDAGRKRAKKRHRRRAGKADAKDSRNSDPASQEVPDAAVDSALEAAATTDVNDRGSYESLLANVFLLPQKDTFGDAIDFRKSLDETISAVAGIAYRFSDEARLLRDTIFEIPRFPVSASDAAAAAAARSPASTGLLRTPLSRRQFLVSERDWLRSAARIWDGIRRFDLSGELEALCPPSGDAHANTGAAGSSGAVKGQRPKRTS
ncbi:hypothetical protein HK105_202700 [Polyrhizophydium stewartii]|uniref:G domain-containing protein n=1 Tax=Polyrhizophydium stewartii TaxID=2732419 RepID=A0ABR4NE86_9FUNG